MKSTKITAAIILSLFMASCSSDKLQISDAKKCINNYMDAIKQKDFDKAISYYSNESNDNKLDEIKKLDAVFGDIKNAELIDSAEVNGEDSNVQLTYKIIHANLESKEKFVLIKEEGEYKIFAHQVRSGIE